jgi:ABC-2 type transport system permease protein
MQVFKVYFKVIRSNRGQLIMYVMIFLLMTFLVSAFYSNVATPQTAAFSASRPKAAIINEDDESALVEGFTEYFSEHVSLQDMDDRNDALKDALFFHSVEYAVKIPKGFTEAFMKGEDVSLEAAGTPDSTNAVFLQTLVDRYFATAALYVKYGKGSDQAGLARLVQADLDKTAPMRVESSTPVRPNEGQHLYVFNYLSYTLFAVLILGVTTFMLSFNETDLKRRNLCAPIRSTSMNLQMFLANMVFGMVCWALMSGLGVAIYAKEMISIQGLWLCLNAFVFMIACLGISFLLGTLIKKRNAQAPLQNTLTLAFSFLSGAFVPQFMLGKTVLTIASFTPTYWYIKSNHAIVGLSNFSLSTIAPVLFNMLVVLGFGAAALLVAMAISKKRSAGGLA